MISRIEVAWRRMRRWMSRSEWGVIFLKLSRSEGTESDPGLIMIQIDGLSKTQFERALAARRMPFTKRLIEREGYHLFTLYSGQPSTTPAVQGELFYGLTTAVPAFQFRHRETGVIMQMNERAGEVVEAGLREKGTGLLKEGSSYCNIYSGGAGEFHICGVSGHLIEFFRAVNPFYFAGLVILHGRALLRVLALVVAEAILAVWDFFHGLSSWNDFLHELVFVPKRVGVSVLMREVAVIGAQIDCARGLPIIHCNLLGYDEQAHRRGPDSAFAHWSLGGIDDAIRRIADAARQSHRRDYDIWVYSDHGQERTVPYVVEEGREIAEAVEEIFGGTVERRQKRRRSWLSDWLGNRFFPAEHPSPPPDSVVVAALGPVGHIYTPRKLSMEEKSIAARDLVARARVPIVILPHAEETVGWTKAGAFQLPEDCGKIFGSDHPFLDEIGHDLIALGLHPDAGDLIILGWRKNRPMTFVFEHGAHAGPGVEETRAFALLPPDAPVEIPEGRAYLRPMDLRSGALIALRRTPVPAVTRKRHVREIGESVRIMTYNVHSCIGMDGKLSPARIARVIARYSPDIVALQELDVGRMRTRGMDQAHLIAKELEMDFHFHPALRLEEELYGDAILSRHPMTLKASGALPGFEEHEFIESRGALWAIVEIDGSKFQVINTHFGLSTRERLLQAEAILGPEWLGHPDCAHPVILCGDFNAPPDSAEYRRICGVLRDTQKALHGHRPQPTWLTRYPFRRIDYVFVGPDIRVKSIHVPRTELTGVASDHFPLIVELVL